RQHRSQEPLHHDHLGERNQGSPQVIALCLRRRHGDGDGEEREARYEKEGGACSHRHAAQAMAPKGWCLYVL
ncbi:hypothetical protein LINGRAHAP2_LOCUS15234, partial [Linum grandiflorum]